MTDIPILINDVLNKIKEGYVDILKNNLVGIYIHGSIAMGCFNPKTSDIDFLVVVKEKLNIKAKKKIIKLLLELSNSVSENGLEMSIVLQDFLKKFEYPTPYELHFSNKWKQRYLENKVDFTKRRKDFDLIAHLVIIKERGVCLSGKPISKVFYEMPKKYYLKAIIKNFEWNINNISKSSDPGTCPVTTYGVLNLCRVFAFIDDKIITSKKEGGEWGLKNLPREYQSVIQQALNKYTNKENVENLDSKILKRFLEYANNKFKKIQSEK